MMSISYLQNLLKNIWFVLSLCNRIDFNCLYKDAFQTLTEKNYDQIAYGIEPMVFAAAEAYKETMQDKYADLAGHLAAWFLGANEAGVNMYDVSTGRGYDAISSASNVNHNSGAESTIEALLTLEKVESSAAIKAALNKYKKP